jgi:arsenite/tail-anchored protein-transporting ATPase
MPLSDLGPSPRQLILCGGKGGVGKTTFAASLALWLAQAQRTLVVSTDPAHSLGDSLGQPLHLTGAANQVVPVAGEPRLFALEIDAEAALAAFRARHHAELHHLFDTSTYLDGHDLDSLLGLPLPGIDEVMGFKVIADLVAAGSYDKLVVDTAPTGHALRLLALPDLLDQWVKALAQLRWKYRTVQHTFKGKYTPDDADDLLLDLKKTVGRLRGLLTDPERCEFVVVAKPEAMVLAETERLVAALAEHRVLVRHLVMNQVMPDDPSDFCRQVRASQAPFLAQARAAFPTIELAEAPMYPRAVRGLADLRAYGEALFGQQPG